MLLLPSVTPTSPSETLSSPSTRPLWISLIREGSVPKCWAAKPRACPTVFMLTGSYSQRTTVPVKSRNTISQLLDCSASEDILIKFIEVQRLLRLSLRQADYSKIVALLSCVLEATAFWVKKGKQIKTCCLIRGFRIACCNLKF